MTVEELIEHLMEMPQDAEVYMITDISESNRNEEGRYITADKVESVKVEEICDDSWDSDNEINVLLIVGDGDESMY